MLSNIKTRIFKLCEMSRDTLTLLKLWAKRNPAGSLDVETFSNPALRVAQATNASGEVVCFSSVETAYVIGSLVHNPFATIAEIHSAGASIETEIAHLAQLSGVTELLMVVPNNLPSMEGEEFIRVVRRKIVPQIVAMQGVGCSNSNPSLKFVN
jgi:hypothetical protein